MLSRIRGTYRLVGRALNREDVVISLGTQYQLASLTRRASAATRRPPAHGLDISRGFCGCSSKAASDFKEIDGSETVAGAYSKAAVCHADDQAPPVMARG